MARLSEPVKEKALVLRSIRHSESSRIVTLFGATRGKFAVIAKGARRGKHGSALSGVEPPSMIEALVYFKPNRSVQTLGAISILRSYRELKADLLLTGYTAVILQLLDRSLAECDPNENAFDTASAFLERLLLQNGDKRPMLWQFQLQLFRIIGFELNPFPCPACGKLIADTGRYNTFSLDSGAICCHNCNTKGAANFTLSGESVGIIRTLTRNNAGTFPRLKISPAARDEITRALTQFLKLHHPGVGDLPALSMLERFENT